jgi:hypothetical protein
MAKTGQRGAVIPLHQVTSDLATLGFEKGLWTEEDLKWIWATVASACKRDTDKWLYLAKCKANGLSPLRGELFAIARRTQGGGETVTFVTSSHVFMSRAAQAGYLLRGECVCEGDEFLWDAKAGEPVIHRFNPLGARGRVLGAWASATQQTTKLTTGRFWPVGELFSKDPNPLRDRMPGHFAVKTATMRVARMVVPDLSALYGAEEHGVVVAIGEERAALPSDVARDLPEEPHEQVRAQTEEPYSPSKEAAGEPVDADFVDGPEPAKPEGAPLSFKERSALLKRLATEVEVVGRAVLPWLTKALGRPVERAEDLRASDFAAIEAAITKEKKS